MYAIRSYYDHYAMMVELMEPMIIGLGNQERYNRSVEELFRIFHNIKSASGYLKMEPMSRLAALAEDVLEQLRTQYSSANDDTVTWLINVADMFMQWQEDLKMDNELSKVHFSLLILPDMENA